ncbi:MAG: M14 family metallopeptidase [Bacteroidales bacterium]|nr:M14 family metallopeptidase [Bacteroidales bacterium]
MNKLLLSSVILLASLTSFSQTRPTPEYYMPAGINFDRRIPAPGSIGHEVGEWHITHDRLVGYMKLLDGLSGRAQWEDYGKSWEGRPLGQLIITSEKNMSRLEEIRTEHLKLSDPAVSRGLSTAGMPLIIKFGYGVHGNESSAQNASILTAYYLVAGQSPQIDEILDKCVILVDPSLNPDGLQRHSTWVNMHRGMTLATDPSGREFNEAWPGGRTNHYWFDLNRDYLMLQHPESVGRVEAFHRWMPNINTDHHEMGANSTFFFQPGVQSRNNPVVPPDNQALTAEIGSYHAQYLDSIGSLYYTEESFDDYYLGKGSSYPDAHGSVGILFEQAGTKGHLREVPGGLLSFPFAIRNQFNVSLSTIEAGMNMRVRLLDMQRDFYLSALREADASPVKGYLFSAGADRGGCARFIENLLRHKIEVYECGRQITKNGVTYNPGDSWFVPIRQKEYRFVRALFETVKTFSDTVFYDISTWVMPMAFNLNYTSLGSTETAGMTGERMTTPPFPAGTVIGIEKDYAWLFEWSDTYAPKALYMLQGKGLTARVATAPFTAVMSDGKKKSFGYGTIMVQKGENPIADGDITSILQGVAADCGITIYGVSTGLTPAGIDLGSGGFTVLSRPSVMLVIDEGTPADDAGEIWHLLDVRYDMPVTLVSPSRIGSANLGKYNVIIIAGNPSVPSAATERIRDWARSGGTLIGYRGGNRWLASNGFAEISYIESAATDQAKERNYASRSVDRAIQTVPGTIFRTAIDITHPLCYGYSQPYLPVFKTDASAVKVTGSSYNTPVKYTADPLLSGYCSKENLQRIAGSAAVTVHQGPVRVISIYDDTNFRAIWYGTSKLFMNAVFFGQLLRQEGRYGY